MRKFAYYNEVDPKAAAWIRELIKAGLVTDGEVDERSIEDVLPSDVVGFARCHWFAGIAVWDYALNQAGYDRWDKVTWTGSCPCQPFSAAGKRGGTSDERHLWPAFHWLIQQRRPDVIFGEQVASKDGLAWLDVVQSDLEAAGYAIGALDLCAAGFGAPHIRQRLFFVADSESEQSHGRGNAWRRRREFADYGKASGLANAAVRDGQRSESRPIERSVPSLDGKMSTDGNLADTLPAGWAERRAKSGNGQAAGSGSLDQLGNASLDRNGAFNWQSGESGGQKEPIGRSSISSPTNGFWRDAEWIYCRDEKYRAVEPGTLPLATGIAARMVRLRGYGNSIVAPVAEELIRAYMEITE